ncbi:hypothetical protein [Bradyrhizobium sp. SZCCHNRI3052]|uniref:hypothetical protein n=1 Tax=Bradyrhizobium sp. SZCCHNRI3052 TaxID=3057295 RepID=UPI0029162D46|nr:hypothetical protein [Bradyrhizobium sp. SZCCHNRI3052]
MDVPKRRLIWDLVQGGLSEESFIAQFGANPRTTPEIVRVELEESLTERSTDNLRFALILAFRFGLSRQWAPLLCKLMGEDWHHSHEDIAGALQDLRFPVTIDCLYRTALRKHDYLAYNDNESLAIKCIWALHDIGTPEAAEKLQRLSQSDLSARVREKALKRLSALAVTRPGDPVPAYRRARDQKVRPDWDLGGSQRDK